MDEDDDGEETEGGIGQIPVRMHFGISCLFGGYILYREGHSSVFTSVDTLLAKLKQDILELDRLSFEQEG